MGERRLQSKCVLPIIESCRHPYYHHHFQECSYRYAHRASTHQGDGTTQYEDLTNSMPFVFPHKKEMHRHETVQAWSHTIRDGAKTVGEVLAARKSLSEFGKGVLYVGRAVLPFLM